MTPLTPSRPPLGQLGRERYTQKWIILATTSNQAKNRTGTIAVASILRFHDAVTATKAVGNTTGMGAIERGITTKTWSVLITTSHIVGNLARTIVVTSIQRYHDVATY